MLSLEVMKKGMPWATLTVSAGYVSCTTYLGERNSDSFILYPQLLSLAVSTFAKEVQTDNLIDKRTFLQGRRLSCMLEAQLVLFEPLEFKTLCSVLAEFVFRHIPKQ